ncbi:similar to Saccharomyces cerevisiae YPL074W YTA6 Putative ATPase of the CDC48/PAS1/SEC18 (AAA) family, localized to the cortex of mother cells but not to daughter cells [Maudiozyma saulgeensis]|uniref:Similar to Saccharomyces cerevisiae YPL074W YTA6 Putative ATPase of the CDC48/PAS1/SEC18 (AAA) family, localized to the cortex of mother cells but not to daughter cells n=1 Tax=Maudiozyma saulgeensis TaxID=1789683 RepID=A0A1X7R6B0_9SACH|nr:similar to Saccharomyces cerevisiae YPL074W YTA6 Putative ATPase of the CDC48/PAS1/SEC18 (AAA) family, localized to the cortex of mother cells but not to daughter cells [Kazachstania saulgeensis]
MSDEKFIVPGNLSLSQSLDLLFSIVHSQVANITEKINSIKSETKEIEKLPPFYKELCYLLKYVNDGLKTIEANFNITSWKSLITQNETFQNKIEDFQILGHEIRVLRKNVLATITDSKSDKRDKLLDEALSGNIDDSNTVITSSLLRNKSFNVPTFWVKNSKKKEKFLRKQESNDNEIMQRVKLIKDQRKLQLEERERGEEEKRLIEEKRLREVEEQQKKLLDLQIENEVKNQVAKRMEKEKQKRVKEIKTKKPVDGKPKEDKDSNANRGDYSNQPSLDKQSREGGGRRSFDMTRHRLTYKKDTMHNLNRSKRSMRRSLDIPSHNRTSSDMLSTKRQSSEENISKAALAAWSSFSNDIPKQESVPSYVSTRRDQNKNHRNRPHVQPNRQRSIGQITNSGTRDDSGQSSNSKVKLKRQKSKERVLGNESGNKALKKTTPPEKKEKFPSDMTPDTSQQASDTIDGIDPVMLEQIRCNILVQDDIINWDDVAGLNSVKASLKETVVYPFLRPDLFKGLREPIRGMLLFGPPGTGKTMIAKAVATESNSTFFSISASSLLSKYLGESEKLVKALFYLARKMAPSIIFIDEIDSIMGNRSDNENESSRRIKTEVLIQWSNLSKAAINNVDTSDQRVLVLGATNLPWVIDDAARRRFSRRLYIPLPDFETRLYHLKRLLRHQPNVLTESNFKEITELTEGYSGSDLTALAKEAAMEPIRELGDQLIDANFENIRKIGKNDFTKAMATIKKSVSPESLKRFDDWAAEYGSMGS